MKHLTSSPLTPVFLLWFALILGCSSTGNHNSNNQTTSPPSVSQIAAPPETYGTDLKGQFQRIVNEGKDESEIRENIAAADNTITYEHLKKNADKHAGKPWSFTGKILEIQEQDNITIARISIDDWGSKPIYVIGPISTDFLENNRVFVAGYLAGSHSYESQAGWQITIPALAARTMLKPAEAAKYRAGKVPAKK